MTNRIIIIINAVLVGGISILIAVFFILSIFGILSYGIGGFLMPMYFWGYIIKITPLGMLIGLAIGMYDLVRKPEKIKQTTSEYNLILNIVFPLLLLLIVTFSPLIIPMLYP